MHAWNYGSFALIYIYIYIEADIYIYIYIYIWLVGTRPAAFRIATYFYVLDRILILLSCRENKLIIATVREKKKLIN
jgi:hypothetical protein